MAKADRMPASLVDRTVGREKKGQIEDRTRDFPIS
jgi:hypothetical protein